MAEVIIRIDPQTGEHTVEVQGIADGSCKHLTDYYRRLLGPTTTVQRTPTITPAAQSRGLKQS